MTPPSDPPLHIHTPLVLGPLVIGTCLNTLIYGICVAQFSNYWESKSKDTRRIRFLVWWTFILDTFHTGSLLYMLWVYAVVEFENASFLQHVLWPFSATPAITTLTSFPIQVYLSWRIRLLSQSIRAFAVLLFLSAIQASLGITCSVAAFERPHLSMYAKLIPYVDAWQVFAVLADGSITVLLVWFLIKKRTGEKQSDSVITRVIRLSTETAAVGAFFCIMDLISFTALQGSNIHVIFAFPLGRIYTQVFTILARPNTLLLVRFLACIADVFVLTWVDQTLNSRSSLREELQRPIIPDVLLSRNTGANSGQILLENTRARSRGRQSSTVYSGVGNINLSLARPHTTTTIDPLPPPHNVDSEVESVVKFGDAASTCESV